MAEKEEQKKEELEDQKDESSQQEAEKEKAGADEPISEEKLKHALDHGSTSTFNFSFSPIVLYIILGLNLLIMLSVFGYIYYAKFVFEKTPITEKSEREKLALKKDAIAQVIEYKLDPFTVNLGKSKVKKYVNARFTLIAVDWETRDEIDRKVDKIRDAIIGILDSKYPEELITVQGKLFLKDQILTSVNRILVKGSIREVYIESFLIQ